MGSIAPFPFRLTGGEQAVVRSATSDDAAGILALAREVIAESRFSITQPEEFLQTVEQQRDWISRHTNAPGQLVLLAETGGQPVGLLELENGQRKRIAHRGTLTVCVAAAHRRQGVATALLEALFRWAEEHPLIEKLALATLANNEPAIRLFQKLGFQEEGRRPREVKFGPDKYVDDVLMYRWVNAQSPPA
jgi:RimJ/RimL family protein N-acetyltransferase